MPNSADNNSLQRAHEESEQRAGNALSELQPEVDIIENANSTSAATNGNSGEKQQSQQRGETINPARKSSTFSAKQSSVEHIEDFVATQATPPKAIAADPDKKLPYFPRTRISRKFRWLPPSDDTQWGIHWYKPTLMVFLALCGLFAALGHHLYNANLHGSRVGDPEWPQRWGVALAFFIKMVLVDAVRFAYTQSAWRVVRRRPFKIRTLNGLFSVCNDPWQFLSTELLLHAIIPALLAGLTWILPLCAIAAPASLTSRTGIEITPTTCPSVPSLNFSRDNGYDIEAAGDHGKTILSLWDTLDNGTHFYVGPTDDLNRMFTLSILSDSAIQPANPCPGSGNCTYGITFGAPSFECEERSEWPEAAPWTRSQFGSSGYMIYGGWSSGSDDTWGVPTTWANLSKSDDRTGVFTEVPSLWVGWVTNTSKPLAPSQGNTTLWKHQINGHVMECVLHNSTYSYTLSFIQGEMYVNESHVEPLHPMLSPGAEMAPWQPTYQQWAGYYAAGFLYRNFLSGNITQDAMGPEENYATYPNTNAEIIKTDMLIPRTEFPVSEDHFIEDIESHFHDLFLALLTDHVLQISVINVSVPCTVTSTVLVWSYSPFWLALSYLLAVSTTFIALSFGLYAYQSNGVAMESEFSTFLSTTRNAEINEMARGSSLGAWPAKAEFLDERLMFGVLRNSNNGGSGGEGKVGFGREYDIDSVVFGKKYS